MSFTLTLLGTDTQFSPNKVENSYDRAETLSYISTMIENKSTGFEDDTVRFKNNQVAVIDGPTTLGSEVGDRIARGVAAALEAISRGETHINVIAHSRGAVEAILVAHELERIQTLMEQQSDDFNDEVLKSPCPLTQGAMNTHQQTFANLNWEQLKNNIACVKLSILNVDPVPGGDYVGITHFSSLAWNDPRFYQLPKIVKEYEQYIYENERTRCFKPIVPKPVSAETQFKLISLPGHHGTGSGNLLDQQRRANALGANTTHVQELTIVKLIEFLSRNGVKMTPRRGEDDPFCHLTKKLFDEHGEPQKEHFKPIYFALYNEILANKDAYKQYNNTAYAFLGQEQSILKLFWNITDQRIVHYHAHNDTYLETIIPPVPGGRFLNYEHAHLSLNRDLGLSGDNIPLNQTIDKAVTRLLEIARHHRSLRALDENKESLLIMDSFIEDDLACALYTTEGFELLLDGVSTIIEEVRQTYLQGKLTDTQERADVYHAVQNTFKQFAEYTSADQDNEIARTIYETFRSNLRDMLTKKHEGLQKHYQDLVHRMQQKQFVSDLNEAMQQLNEQLADNKLTTYFTQFIMQLNELNSINPNVSEINEFLQSKFTQLQQIEFEETEDVSNRDCAGLLIVEAIAKNQRYTTDTIIREVISTSNELDAFKKALPDFQNIDSTVINYEQHEALLAGRHKQVVDATAQFIAAHNIALETLKGYFDKENEALYKEISSAAICLGVDDPLVLANQEQCKQIQELDAKQEQQKNEIGTLTAEKETLTQEVRELTTIITQLNSEQSAYKSTIEDEHHSLTEQVTQLTDAIHRLQFEKNNFDIKIECKFQTIVEDRLSPLTKDYLLHLAKKVKQHVNPHLDLNDVANLANNVAAINTWPEEQSVQGLKDKFAKVATLYTILESTEKPSEKVKQFYQELDEARDTLLTHRDAAGKRFAKNALIVLSIILTGVIPGLAVLFTQSTPKFWQSTGQTFFQSTKGVDINVANHEPESALAEESRPYARR
ncbi:hypothetical protein ACD661_11585 [Legionella lytica]|uniref:Uncharacterized protein n=1 Tax=Legionella lytica TaxID=96232 RepID=A0ABW8D917_9GAMM